MKAILTNLATSNDHRTTILGVVLAGLQVANIDWSKLLSGDNVEIGKAVGAIVTALLGYLINKPNQVPPPPPPPITQ